MPKAWKLVLVGLLAFSVFLLARFPAQLAWQWFAPAIPGFSPGSMSGTIWNGSMRQASVGRSGITRITWTLHPAEILSGGIGLDAVAELQDGRIQASIRQSFSGHTEIHDLQGSVMLNELAAAGISPVAFADGEVVFNLEWLELEGARPVAAEGRIGVTGLQTSLLRGVPLGSYQASLSTGDDGSIVATLADVDAPVSLQGQFVMQASGSYSVDAKLLPHKDAPEKIRQGLQLLGQPDGSGRYPFRSSGRITF